MLCAGTVAAAVINANPFRAEGSKPVRASDFVPEWSPKPRKQQTLKEQVAVLKAIFGCGPDLDQVN